MLVLAKFAKDKPAVLGAIIVLAVVVIAVLAPLLAPYPADVSASHLLRRLKPPSWEHPVRHRQSRPRHLLARHPRHARRADDRADGGRHLHG